MKKVFYVKLRGKGNYLNRDHYKEMNVIVEFDDETKIAIMEEIVKEIALEAALDEWEDYIPYLEIDDFCEDEDEDDEYAYQNLEKENEAIYEEFVDDIHIFMEEKNSVDGIKQDIPVIRTFIR